jgi:hypothetical protein
MVSDTNYLMVSDAIYFFRTPNQISLTPVQHHNSVQKLPPSPFLRILEHAASILTPVPSHQFLPKLKP